MPPQNGLDVCMGLGKELPSMQLGPVEVAHSRMIGARNQSCGSGPLPDNWLQLHAGQQRLASLVRKTLPHAAAICSQYFAFQRRPSETIGNFLVRESLVHEEFCEAIIRLHEDCLGISQESRDFGLPAEHAEEWTDSAWQSSWWQDGGWWEDDFDAEDFPDPAPDAAQDPAAATDPQRGATGSSPSHHGPGSTKVGFLAVQMWLTQ